MFKEIIRVVVFTSFLVTAFYSLAMAANDNLKKSDNLSDQEYIFLAR